MALYELHNPGAPIALRFGELALTAFSVSALATYVMVPAFDACFDLGHCPLEATRLRHVFLSHTHQDHAAGVPRHLAMRQMVGARPSRVFVPTESRADLVDLLRAFERLERKPAADLEGVVRGVAPGDVVSLGGRYTVQVFDVVHRLASRGYTVVEQRRVLKPAYRGHPGPEIGAAHARGEEVYDRVARPVFTYVGDSTVETLRRHPEVGQSDVLFLEATHLPGTDHAVSRRYGHTHLDDLIELYAETPAALASPHVVLKHFSTRYTRGEILRAADALPAGLRERVTLLV